MCSQRYRDCLIVIAHETQVLDFAAATQCNIFGTGCSGNHTMLRAQLPLVDHRSPHPSKSSTQNFCNISSAEFLAIAGMLVKLGHSRSLISVLELQLYTYCRASTNFPYTHNLLGQFRTVLSNTISASRLERSSYNRIIITRFTLPLTPFSQPFAFVTLYLVLQEK